MTCEDQSLRLGSRAAMDQDRMCSIRVSEGCASCGASRINISSVGGERPFGDEDAGWIAKHKPFRSDTARAVNRDSALRQPRTLSRTREQRLGRHGESWRDPPTYHLQQETQASIPDAYAQPVKVTSRVTIMGVVSCDRKILPAAVPRGDTAHGWPGVDEVDYAVNRSWDTQADAEQVEERAWRAERAATEFVQSNHELLTCLRNLESRAVGSDQSGERLRDTAPATTRFILVTPTHQPTSIHRGVRRVDCLVARVHAVFLRDAVLVQRAQLLQRQILRLGHPKREQQPEEAARREYVEHALEAERALGDDREALRRNDSAHLARGGGDAMARRTHGRGEDLGRDDEGRGVGAEVEEELRERVHDDEEGRVVGFELVEEDGHEEEEQREQRETHVLDGLAAPLVHEVDREPVAGHRARQVDDGRAHGAVPQVVVYLLIARGLGGAVADDLEHHGRVERRAVVADVQEEPGRSTADEHLEVGPLVEVVAERVGEVLEEARLAVAVARGVSGILRRQYTAASAGTAPKAASVPPAVAERRRAVVEDAVLGGGQHDDGHDGARDDTEALHGEDGGDHGAAALGRRELAGDDRGHGVVSADADAQHEAPDAEHDEQVVALTVHGPRREGAQQRAADEHHELDAVDALATEDVAEDGEGDLAHGVAVGRGSLDPAVGARREARLTEVLVGDHGHHEADHEVIVRVHEEARAGHEDGLHVGLGELGVVERAERVEALVGRRLRDLGHCVGKGYAHSLALGSACCAGARQIGEWTVEILFTYSGDARDGQMRMVVLEARFARRAIAVALGFRAIGDLQGALAWRIRVLSNLEPSGTRFAEFFLARRAGRCQRLLRLSVPGWQGGEAVSSAAAPAEPWGWAAAHLNGVN
ncbi:hypothetical protein ON010_g9365 [Phytophthora cinnamomi]|nr:hypothetical protein ON010_g9365 [Phytophthora cinnamomi]